MSEVEAFAREQNIETLSLGAANEELQRLYEKRYGFADDRLGCTPPSRASRTFLAEWHRAYVGSDGLYGHLMTKCLSRRSAKRRRAS